MRHVRTGRKAASLRGTRPRRSAAPLLLGMALTGGALLASAWLSRRPGPIQREIYSDYEEWARAEREPPSPAVVLPPMIAGLLLMVWQAWRFWTDWRAPPPPPPAPEPPSGSRLAPWIAMAGDLWRKRATRPTLH